MNKAAESEGHNIANNMNKRVQFAANLAKKRDALQRQDSSGSEGSSGWYTAKELRAFRREVSASLDAEKVRNDQLKKRPRSRSDSNDDCMRGLELYASDVRRDLQKHYSRSILLAQRRIKARRKRKGTEEEGEDSLLLQRIAEKYSRYARERAVQIASRDEVDSRQVYAESQQGCIVDEPPFKKQFQQQHSNSASRVFQPSRKLSFPTVTVPRAPSRLGMPGLGH